MSKLEQKNLDLISLADKYNDPSLLPSKLKSECENQAVHESLTSITYGLANRFSGRDRILLYFVLLSPSAKDSLISWLRGDVQWPDDERSGISTPVSAPGKTSGFLKGVITGILATIAVTSIAIQFHQTLKPSVNAAVTEVQK